MHLLVERHFHHVLTVAQRDISFFIYVLAVLGEGIQSTQSCPMISSFECIELMHNYQVRSNNAFFKQAMTELLST